MSSRGKEYWNSELAFNLNINAYYIKILYQHSYNVLGMLGYIFKLYTPIYEHVIEVYCSDSFTHGS